MTEINLLPLDLSPARNSLQVAKKIQKAIILLSGLFVIIVVAGVALILFFTNEVNSSDSKQASIKQNIQSQENTEQRFVLIKDRLAKIKLAMSQQNVETSFESINQILNNLPSGVSVNDVEIDVAGTGFSVVSSNSLDMANFLNSIVTNGTYKNLTLKSFFFSPEIGYTISLIAS